MRKLTLLALLAASGPLWAHPGHGQHGHHGFSLLHYLTEPEHVAGLVLLVAVIGGVAGWLWQRRRVK